MNPEQPDLFAASEPHSVTPPQPEPVPSPAPAPCRRTILSVQKWVGPTGQRFDHVFRITTDPAHDAAPAMPDLWWSAPDWGTKQPCIICGKPSTRSTARPNDTPKPGQKKTYYEWVDPYYPFPTGPQRLCSACLFPDAYHTPNE